MNQREPEHPLRAIGMGLPFRPPYDIAREVLTAVERAAFRDVAVRGCRAKDCRCPRYAK